MNLYYADIIERMPAQPIWWDEHAVPRYCEFGPRETADIYCDECCLAEIACQQCGHKFKVAFSTSQTERLLQELRDKIKRLSLAEEIQSATLHYGDPPNIQCCSAGNTMNSEMIRVIEYWNRRTGFSDWERKCPVLERTFESESARFGMGD